MNKHRLAVCVHPIYRTRICEDCPTTPSSWAWSILRGNYVIATSTTTYTRQCNAIEYASLLAQEIDAIFVIEKVTG